MNKYTIGTIIGAALLGLSKKGSRTKLTKSKLTEITIRNDGSAVADFGYSFLKEEERLIPWDWEDSEIPLDQNHEYVETINRIEKRIYEIVSNIDWTRLNKELGANKYESYEVYMDSYVDMLHERFEHDQDGFLSEYRDPDNNWNYVEDKAIVHSYPADIGFVYIHDAVENDPNATPPKSVDEIKEMAEKSFQIIYDAFVSHGIYLEGHADWKSSYGEWSGQIYDEQDHIYITSAIHILKNGQWEPYKKDEPRTSKLRRR